MLYWTPKNPNGKPNFNDFKPFGGWNKPIVKLYQTAATVCGADFDLRYSSWGWYFLFQLFNYIIVLFIIASGIILLI